MDTLLQISRAHKSFATKDLFVDASMAVNEGEHVGVIGPNGAGKTTLFKVLAGEDDFDNGEVIRSRNLRLGYLRQHDDWAAGESVEAFVLRNSHMNAWEIKSLGRGLGLELSLFDQPMSSLSGGYKMRVKLLALLAEQPNLLLLDEPTNYLDLETMIFLESFLAEYKGAYLLISHDREFLRKTCNHILEIEGGEMTKYPGALDDYFEQKHLLAEQLKARAMTLDAKRKEVLDFVARFGAKASKASQAQSRLKQLAKMETIEIKPLSPKARVFMPPVPPLPKINFELRGVAVGYGERAVLTDVSLEIERGDHIGVVGFNGAGKSTLLKTLSARLPAQRGSVRTGDGVKLALYAQHVGEGLNPELSVLDELSGAATSQVTLQEIKSLAGSLLFSGDDIQKKIRVLSGGERSRVALGKILLSGCNVLLLDEPTNHLDFDTVEALGTALRDFQGTLIVVSHDRGFLKKVSRKILEIRDGRVSLYPGTYDDYVWSLQRGILSHTSEAPVAPARNAAKESTADAPEKGRNLYNELKSVESDLRKSEKSVDRFTAELKMLEESFAAPGASYDKDQAVKLNELRERLGQEEENYLNLLEKRDTLKKEGGSK